MADIHFSQQPYYKALTASIQQLENPEWVTENLFPGDPGSLTHDRCLEALRLRGMVEDMKGKGLPGPGCESLDLGECHPYYGDRGVDPRKRGSALGLSAPRLAQQCRVRFTHRCWPAPCAVAFSRSES